MALFRRKKEVAPPRKKVALCLSGGGLRGFGHIGILKALEEHDFKFDIVVGTSIGSFVGSMYASGMHPDEMMIYCNEVEIKEVKKGFILASSDALPIGKIVTNFVGDINIEDLKTKFACVAVDLVEAKQVILDRGSLGLAVSASCAIPLVFKPVIRGQQHLVDGGVLNNIPADVCRMLGADYVVTADINPTRGAGTSELKYFDILKAVFTILSSTTSLEGYRHSDIIIAPNLGKFKSTQKDGAQEMVKLGYAEAKKHISKIKEIFNAASGIGELK